MSKRAPHCETHNSVVFSIIFSFGCVAITCSIIINMARAILLVPPFIKYNSGPLLGPALLQSAARNRGHACTVLDLNAHYIEPRALKRLQHGTFIGDHDKRSSVLSDIENVFMSKHVLPGLSCADDDLYRRVQFGFLTHDEVQSAANTMAGSFFGSWVRDVLIQQQQSGNDPQVVGLSLLHAGQVIPALAVSMVARTIWPQALLLWGGPHISGLGLKQTDLAERSYAADVFVNGHAEQTFTDILDKVASGDRWKRRSNMPTLLSGTSGGSTVSPTFENLELYDSPLTLPAQSALGCAYGRCTFCTYPAIEPKPVKLDLTRSVGVVADLAVQLRASVSVKDSLATSSRLCAIGDHIGGRVPWSACTKLSSRLDLVTLSRLRHSGLATLEVGLESLLPDTQKRIGKIQPQELFERFVDHVADVPDLTLVVNYMVGFPWEDSAAAYAKLEEARMILENRLGRERACIELNKFELERLAPMARFPEVYGIASVRSWPWASVLEYTTTNE